MATPHCKVKVAIFISKNKKYEVMSLKNVTSPFAPFYRCREMEGNIVGYQRLSKSQTRKVFKLFKELFDYGFGEIVEHGNLIEIHVGGWSYNEGLIKELMKTEWWFRNFRVEKVGGHYYFNNDIYKEKKWIVTRA